MMIYKPAATLRRVWSCLLQALCAPPLLCVYIMYEMRITYAEGDEAHIRIGCLRRVVYPI